MAREMVHAKELAQKIALGAARKTREAQRIAAKAYHDHVDPRVHRGIDKARKGAAIEFARLKGRVAPRLDVVKNAFRNGHFWRGRHAAA